MKWVDGERRGVEGGKGRGRDDKGIAAVSDQTKRGIGKQ